MFNSNLNWRINELRKALPNTDAYLITICPSYKEIYILLPLQSRNKNAQYKGRIRYTPVFRSFLGSDVNAY